MFAAKLLPQLFAFFGIAAVVLRGYPERRRPLAVSVGAGFAVGAAVAFFLFRNFPGSFPFELIRTVVGASFFLFWGIAVTALYRSSERALPDASGRSSRLDAVAAPVIALGAAVTAGALAACRFSGNDAPLGPVPALVLLLVIGALLAAAGFFLEAKLPEALTVSRAGTLGGVVALLLLSSSYLVRLDLFSPLSMKVMKGCHDFVHQFMESVLIPDHLFVRPQIWGYIGILFSKEVGFWGGMVIWFTPFLLVAIAVRFELLPSVGHIRQGAQRRKLLAAAIRQRRMKLIVPLLSLVLMAGAAYRSSFPDVEYWDPKPIPVAADPSGDVFIPRKGGEVDLSDGKLHKYLLKGGAREVRFFVMLTPTGKLTVDLDACAICKPDGYGQGEGSVICYYCKTLIPLETVGKPGGCNPVPVAFSEKPDGVHINGVTLVNAWSTTVQSTGAKKEGGK
ncbi:DUF2318 domain-containing protein [Geomesophilobacter sediminis]|nr:DUF2318 domain-containing protein [Geomesophilobacter sediminis]